jgi:hypothetical protein
MNRFGVKKSRIITYNWQLHFFRGICTCEFFLFICFVSFFTLLTKYFNFFSLKSKPLRTDESVSHAKLEHLAAYFCPTIRLA